MKINSIDIAAFGKLKNFHLDFSDGLTVLYGENEKGKTTIMSFIRMMFYGNAGKSSDIDKNLRIKYRPWNSDIMAGSITFTKDGRSYRLEREFKKSNSTDKITLIDLELGTIQSLSGSDDIGAKIIGLSDAAFEKSVFVSELGAPQKNETADGEINSKLSNMSVSGDEDVSYEKVALRLSKAREVLMSKRGKIGKYDKTVAEIENLSSQIDLSLENENEIAKLEKEAALKKEALKEASAQSAALFEQLKNADKIKKRNFIEKFLTASAEYEKVKEKLLLKDGKIADKEFVSLLNQHISDASQLISQHSACMSEISDLGEQIEALESELNTASISSDNETETIKSELAVTNNKIEEASLQSENIKQKLGAIKPVKKRNPIFIVSTALSVLLGILLCFSTFPFASIPLFILGLIFAVLYFVLRHTTMPDTTALQQELNLLASSLSSLLAKKQQLLDQLNLTEAERTQSAVQLASTTALLQSKKSQMQEMLLRANQLREQSEQLFAEIRNLCSPLGTVTELSSAKELAENIENSLNDLQAIGARISILSENSGCQTIEQAEQKLALFDSQGVSSSPINAETLKEEFKAKSEISSKIRSELSAIEAQIKTLCSSNVSAEVLFRQKQELTERANNYKQFCELTDIASDALNDAFRQLRKNYSGALNTRTAEIFSLICDKPQSDINISKNFDISISSGDAFGLKESAYLSSGTEDQLYLALRLSLAELMTEQTGSLPIILDDALAQYDDQRAKSALLFLKQYSSNRQILLYTCHSFFKDSAEELSIKTVEL
ncbi:MAG: AAA family ATPase [Clostridia bacterium]|nr:AAA family ATPase [Clostridia bacterium]